MSAVAKHPMPSLRANIGRLTFSAWTRVDVTPDGAPTRSLQFREVRRRPVTEGIRTSGTPGVASSRLYHGKTRLRMATRAPSRNVSYPGLVGPGGRRGGAPPLIYAVSRVTPPTPMHRGRGC